MFLSTTKFSVADMFQSTTLYSAAAKYLSTTKYATIKLEERRSAFHNADMFLDFIGSKSVVAQTKHLAAKACILRGGR